MPGLLDSYLITESPQFINRVSQAVLGAALRLLGEPEDTPGHADNLRLAREVLRDRNAWGYRVATALSVDPAIMAAAESGEVPDEAITAGVQTLLTRYGAERILGGLV